MDERYSTEDHHRVGNEAEGFGGGFVSLEDLPTSFLASLSELCASSRAPSLPEGHPHG